MELNSEKRFHALLIRRARELGKTLKTMAVEAGLARSGLYKLANGTTRDPSVQTLFRLAAAMEISPIALLRLYGDMNAPKGARENGYSSVERAPGVNDFRDVAIVNADITIPHHAVVNGGEVFEKIWEIQNVGNVFWMGRRLARIDNSRAQIDTGFAGVFMAPPHLHLVSSEREIMIPNTPPGGVVRLRTHFSAPKANCSIASVWRIEDQAQRPCYGAGFFLGVIVTVIDR
jgi:transcriptional regulator with XRE-family HTH domain